MRVLIIGEILVEVMATQPGRGFCEVLDLRGPFPSGAPAIFADQLARQGTETAIVSCVGDDDFGRINLERLVEAGVDISGVAVHPTATTGTAFVRYRGDGARDFLFHLVDAACGQIALTAQSDEQVSKADHIHIMGSGLGASELANMILAAARSVKDAGGTISYDPNLRPETLDARGRERLSEILQLSDLVLPSEGELLAVMPGKMSETEAVDVLVAAGKTVILKRGAEGASWIDDRGRWDQRGFKVTEIDPTGAGDTFGATALHGWLRGNAPQDVLRSSCAAGALAVRVFGPMEGASFPSDLEAFMADYEVQV